MAWLLDGPGACYRVPLPEPGEPRRAILDTYTKAHSAEYQAQAFIDLAFRLRERVGDPARVERVVLRTSDHTHHVIGTGAGDPEKLDPAASRETLDHSVMYIFAVALQDGRWHHVDSYTPSGPPGRTRCGSGTGSSRSRTRPGRPATTTPTRPGAPSAAGPRSSWPAARWSRPSWPWPTPTCSAPTRSPAPTTCASWPPWPRGWSSRAELERFAGLVERLGELGPDELGGLTVAAANLRGPRPERIF